ncbi:hypothetical protein GGR51DRAFT_575076 [Nemania sp. FL0031]|nr:hypothetical protein GGR51DRAFT_575076 [Nemania sp. FL0031]
MADSDIVKMVKERIEFSTDERKFNILVVPADAERHYGERRYCSLIRKQTFHHFARLPAELRVMIWRYAVYLQDRVVEFAKIPGQKIGDKDTMKILCAPVPPLFLGE